MKNYGFIRNVFVNGFVILLLSLFLSSYNFVFGQETFHQEYCGNGACSSQPNFDYTEYCGSCPSDCGYCPSAVSQYLATKPVQAGAQVKSEIKTTCVFTGTLHGILQIIKNVSGTPSGDELPKFYFHVAPNDKDLEITANIKTGEDQYTSYVFNEDPNKLYLTGGLYKVSEIVPSDLNWILRKVECVIMNPCGDEYCDLGFGETCSTCGRDCGPCGTLPCGDGTCDNTIGEYCDTCFQDCGNCPQPSCGGGICSSQAPPALIGTTTGTRVPGKNAIDYVQVNLNRTTRCVFDNELISLKIETHAIGGDGTETFDYNIRKYYGSPLRNDYKLSVKTNVRIRPDPIRGDEYMGSNGKFLKPAIEDYLITQELRDDWVLNSVECSLQDGGSAESQYTVISNDGTRSSINGITIEDNKVTTCTFVNVKKGRLEILKRAQDALGGEKFGYEIKPGFSEYRIPVFPQKTVSANVYVDASGLGSISSSGFIAVSSSGTGTRAMTSVDGAIWSKRNSAEDNDWKSVAFGNGIFVAVSDSGTGNRVMTSEDGANWTIRTSAADNNWQSVTYGYGLFVAVADSGTGDRVMTSPDGVTWTLRNSAEDNDWKSITYGNGLYVAVSDTDTDDDRIMTSDDGINWRTRKSPKNLSGVVINNDWKSVTYGNGMFVAVASSGTGNRVMTSPDGKVWTLGKSAENNDWQSVTYGDGIFVAVSDSGSGNRVMTSEDGVNWTIRTSAADNNWKSVTHSNGLFVAVADSGTGDRVMTSPDGINWSIGISAEDNNWNSVIGYDAGFYPGTYKILENTPQNNSADRAWALKRANCVLEGGEPTGVSVQGERGIAGVDIYAGKTVTCAFLNYLTDVTEGAEDFGQDPQVELKNKK